jgi:hypothetical protein
MYRRQSYDSPRHSHCLRCINRPKLFRFDIIYRGAHYTFFNRHGKPPIAAGKRFETIPGAKIPWAYVGKRERKHRHFNRNRLANQFESNPERIFQLTRTLFLFPYCLVAR